MPLALLGNPLAPLLAAENAGALAGFNPFTEMGVNTNDPNYVRTFSRSISSISRSLDLLTKHQHVTCRWHLL